MVVRAGRRTEESGAWLCIAQSSKRRVHGGSGVLAKDQPFLRSRRSAPDGEDVLDGCVLETAEDSALAQELLQKGPADAQGQESDDEKASANIAHVV